MTPGAGSGEVRSPWDCGHVTQVEGSGEVGHPGECGCVAPGIGCGDCVGLTIPAWVRITCMGRPHMRSLPAVCPVPFEISNLCIKGVVLINLWFLFFSSSCHNHMRSGMFEWVAALCSGE